MFKAIRIIILLLILGSIASTLIIQRNVARDWSGTLDVRIIPVIADQSDSTKKYVESLKQQDFKNINQYLISQAKRFDTDLQYSLNIQLKESTTNIPPTVPDQGTSKFGIIIWSLKLKWWAWRNQPSDYKLSQIRLYVLYQSPEDRTPLPHSTGLQNGLIGLVNARAQTSQRSLHQIIITHELLHILGASDKYDLATGQPMFPDGYANPTSNSPQRFAAIMARAKPTSANTHEVATHLRQTQINAVTASEIGWVKE